MPAVRLLSLETAVPPHRVTREAARDVARAVYGKNLAGYGALDRVFDTSTVDQRWLAQPLDWYRAEHGWADRAAAFQHAALALLEDAATRALASAGLVASDVDHVLCVSTTGFATPSLDARLIGSVM